MAPTEDEDRRVHSEELVFRMSSEARRKEVVTAVDSIDGDSVFAFPVERLPPTQPLLLVIRVHGEYAAQAAEAVLSIDPGAEQQ